MVLVVPSYIASSTIKGERRFRSTLLLEVFVRKNFIQRVDGTTILNQIGEKFMHCYIKLEVM